ncbi:alpha/beta fold hydrolase [Paraburkholderia podalyriae]|uniref:alpha/beta fold hydrolase n=1 Tax=Paraburkholderia TaxID=1822464 RepID=UPI0035E44D0B
MVRAATPVLYSFGAQEDPVVPIDAIDAMAHACFPAARLVRIAQSGHWPHLEQPGDTAAAICDFLLEV